MKRFFIDLHNKIIKNGSLPDANGLCGELRDKYEYSPERLAFNLFFPDRNERLELEKEGLSTSYWGAEQPAGTPGNCDAYTTLRQTIVLFCHEILNS